MSSLPLWMGICPQAKIYMPWVWSGFIAHFGHEYVDAFMMIPDEGMSIPLGASGRSVQLLPSHYLHASGCFSLYDPALKILFSGDIGAALLPNDDQYLFVENFDQHVRYMEMFHRRWMPSNRAKNLWVTEMRKLEIDMICPQHGSIFSGKNVDRFLDWFLALNVGIAVY